MAIKRTFGFDEFQKKISEGIEEIGFKRYVQEHEDENTASVDDLGEGKPLDSTDSSAPVSSGEDAPEATPTAPEKPESDTSIDTGNREDISLDEVKVKMNFISQYVKNLSSLTVSAETVPLDKATKEKIVKLYNIIQGIDNK